VCVFGEREGGGCGGVPGQRLGPGVSLDSTPLDWTFILRCAIQLKNNMDSGM